MGHSKVCKRGNGRNSREDFTQTRAPTYQRAGSAGGGVVSRSTGWVLHDLADNDVNDFFEERCAHEEVVFDAGRTVSLNPTAPGVEPRFRCLARAIKSKCGRKHCQSNRRKLFDVEVGRDCQQPEKVEVDSIENLKPQSGVGDAPTDA